jgi:DNA polymerase III subunit gamma/tau
MLGQAIATQRIAHAYLFSGPRGTGKTSVARILAKAINCLNTDTATEKPCNECANCLAITQGTFMDVVEIDAASNRGVDEARELREQVHIVPSIGQYKVYILDEVHMLTNEAFNALLKTLEEPPAHAVFILCTTESHKVPVTIASRCQRFSFSRAQEAQLQAHLKTVSQAEGVDIEDEALSLLAQLADGGYRDGVMLLDQTITTFQQLEGEAGKPITRQHLERQLGIASRQVVWDIVSKILNKDAAVAIGLLEAYVASGGEVRHLTANLVSQLRTLLFHQLQVDLAADVDQGQQEWLQNHAGKSSSTELAHIIKRLLAAQQQKTAAAHPALALEVAIIEALQAPTIHPAPAAPISKSAYAANPKMRLTPQPEHDDPGAATIDEASAAAPEPAVATPPPAPQAPPADLVEAWQRILQRVLSQNKSVGALLRHHCMPIEFDGSVLQLQFWNSFHKKQVENDKNRIMVEAIAAEVFGTSVKLRGELVDKRLRPKKQPMSEEDIYNVAPVAEENLADTAAEIFGGEFMD